MFIVILIAMVGGLAFAIPTLIDNWKFALSQPVWYVFLTLDGILGALVGYIIKIYFEL